MIDGEYMNFENVTDQNIHQMVAFLQKHENSTFFLSSNFENYGSKLTAEPYSGDFKVIFHEGKIIAVFSLVRTGTLLLHSEKMDRAICDLILQSCKNEPIAIKGLIGEWDLCDFFWRLLKAEGIIKQETFYGKEILYIVDLPSYATAVQTHVRLLSADDYTHWRALRLAYLQEQGLPHSMNDEQMYNHFIQNTRKQIIWGYFVDTQLVSIADLNAKTQTSGSVGGVYTDPMHRKKGFATSVMHQILIDVQKIHKLHKLFIFTKETNLAARCLYEQLNVRIIGAYAMFFGT